MPEPLIVMAGVAVGYGGHLVAEGITLQVDPAESLLFIGGNGAGKTTILKALGGLLKPQAGEARVLNQDLRYATPRTLVRAGCRYLGQGDRSFDGLSPTENHSVLSKLYGFTYEKEGLASAQSANKKIGQLSIGQRRLEALRLLAVGSPRLFLLDEPTAGLDEVARRSIFEWVTERQRQGTSFVIVEQNFRELLDLIPKTVVVRDGRLSYFGPSNTLKDSHTLASALF